MGVAKYFGHNKEEVARKLEEKKKYSRYLLQEQTLSKRSEAGFDKV